MSTCDAAADSFWLRCRLKAKRIGWLCAAILLLVFIAGQVFADAVGNRPLPGLGVAIDAESLANLPRHVWPDGAGLPPGQGDSKTGESVYTAECSACHGPQGEGASAIELVGDRDSLTTEYPDRGIGVIWPFAPTLFEYIQRSMPPAKPLSLSNEQTYAVIAYLLQLNGLLTDGEILDAARLSSMAMPNVDGFIDQYASP